MAGSALGTAFSLLLLASIIQGNPGPHVLVARIIQQQRWDIHRGFEMCMGF